MARLALKEVRKVINDTLIVDDLNLEVGDGEFIVLVGPSGCGKSTTLHMIAGLETPTSGRIEIGDEDVTELPPRARRVAMVFQSYALYPHLTVAGNLGFGLKIAKVAASEITRKVRTIAETLGIVNLLERYPRELSGGQRQRVALGRAIIRDPAVFLFDEPLSNLDAQLRVQMRYELKQLHERLQATAIYVTHDQVEAMTLGSRVVVMDKGVVQQVGPPLEIYTCPVNRFVAQFLGSPAMNFIDCGVERAGEQATMRAGDLSVPLAGRQRSSLDAANVSEVVLGIRPEHLRVNRTPTRETGTVSVPAVIETIDSLGHLTYVNLRVGSHRLMATHPPSAALRPHETVHLMIAADAVHLFHKGTHGKRIE